MTEEAPGMLFNKERDAQLSIARSEVVDPNEGRGLAARVIRKMSVEVPTRNPYRGA
jgi:predicted GNAT family acetyltransferase